ncbi:AraC family transcriptional regulator [Methanohalophilus levihalophilus]|nr:AraC family transcriptional regulator [Methanohalophilus levihalophilus]
MPERKFIGKRLTMSFSENRTYELWTNFMPRRKEILNTIGKNIYSIEVYPKSFFSNFSPDATFEKWAAIEVTDFDHIPNGMENIVSKKGLYAVFLHKGPASSVPKTYQYILEEWLPNSEFLLDEKPYFAIMGEKYKNEEPESEEELCIPIKSK